MQERARRACSSSASPADKNVVTLATIHAAKGLEWPCVFVFDCNEGTLPSSQSIPAMGVNEERRLGYVMFTRASDRLVVHYRSAADQAQDRRISEPSRFISESGVAVQPEVTAQKGV